MAVKIEDGANTFTYGGHRHIDGRTVSGNLAQADSGTCSGSGSVIRASDKQTVLAAGGTIRGEGQIIRKDGTVTDIVLTSDPLTPEQAEALTKQLQSE